MRFLLDRTVGRLAKWLRILGHDAAVDPGVNERELRMRCRREGRVLVTRRTGPGLPSVFRIRSDHTREQLRELMDDHGLSLTDEELFLSRCTLCNIPIEEVDRESVEGVVPDYVFQTQERFHRCPLCRRIYWRGTHPDRILVWLKNDEEDYDTVG